MAEGGRRPTARPRHLFSLQHLPCPSLGPLPIRQRQVREEHESSFPPSGEEGEDLPELLLGAVAVAEAQEAVAQEDADLEQGGIEVEGGAVGGESLVRAAAEVVQEALQGVGGGLRGIGGQGLLDGPAGFGDAVGRERAGGLQQPLVDAREDAREDDRSCGERIGPRPSPLIGAERGNLNGDAIPPVPQL